MISYMPFPLHSAQMPNDKTRHLLHIFPTFSVGGSQIRFGQLARLHHGRFRHSVIALDGVDAMRNNLSADLDVKFVPGRRWPKSFFEVFIAMETLRKIQPDVLVTYNWGTFHWWIAKRVFHNLRHIHIEDGFGPEERVQQLPRRVRARRLVLSDRLTTVVLPSKSLLRLPKLSGE